MFRVHQHIAHPEPDIMKSTILRYGILIGLVAIVPGVVAWFALGSSDYTTSEIIGWIAIVLSLGLVFVGVKHYRDRSPWGAMSFGRGLVAGLGMVAVASLLFAVYSWLFVEFMEPDFLHAYYAHTMEQKRATMDAEAFETYREKQEAMKPLLFNPFFQSVVMFFSVFAPGVAVSLIAAWVFRRRPAEPAEAAAAA